MCVSVCVRGRINTTSLHVILIDYLSARFGQERHDTLFVLRIRSARPVLTADVCRPVLTRLKSRLRTSRLGSKTTRVIILIIVR